MNHIRVFALPGEGLFSSLHAFSSLDAPAGIDDDGVRINAVVPAGYSFPRR